MRLNKILFILHLPPPVHGSSIMGLYIKESEIINTNYDCNYIDLGTSKTIDEIGKKSIGKIFRYFAIIGAVFKALIIHRPAICYFAITVKGVGFYKDTLIVLLVKLFRIKLVYHLHNKGVSKRENKLLDNLLYRFVFKNSEVILLSPRLYPDIQKYVSLNEVHYCPNGVQFINSFTKSEIVKDRVEILFLSNMIKKKGVYILLDACELLKRKNLNFYCTFVGGQGDITDQQFIDKVATKGLANHVKYVGKKLGNEKSDFFTKAHIFAFPTYYDHETFGLVNLEAMQYELPIVSTFEGGIPDVIENGLTGFLVPQEDSNELSEKLALLIQNKELREEMGKKGRIRYEQNFTLKHFENNLVTILNKCLLLKN